VKLLDRYLLRELLPPFIAGGLVFAAVLMLQTTFNSTELLESNAGLLLFLKYILYQMPSLAGYVLPVAVAVGVALMATRFARETEYLTLNAARIPPWRLFLPVLLFALAVGFLTLASEQWLSPLAATKSNQVMNELLARSGREWPSENLFFKGPRGEFYYVRRLSPGERALKDITLLERGERGARILVAPEAHFSGTTWVLEKGAEFTLDREGQLSDVKRFEKSPLQLKEAIQEYWADTRDPSELSLMELTQSVKVMEAAGIVSRKTKEMALEAQFKLVLPLTCVIFALVVFPLAVRFCRGGPFAGLLVAVLVVFFANGALNWSRALAGLGMMSPAIAAWWSPALLLLLGLAVFSRHNVGR